MSSDLCLKWNNHTSAFNKLLSKIHLEDMYSDGTIMCQGKFYPVHRFVLSTCSEYFEEMFRQCIRLNNKHPFIIVKDIHPDQMEALLNYMYKGEVNVPQEVLPELIKAAEAFKIKGLAVPDEEVSPKPSRKRSSASIQSTIPKKSRKQEDSSSSSCKEDNIESNSVSGDKNHSFESQKNRTSQSENLLPGTSKVKIDEIYINESIIPVPVIKAEPIDIQDSIPIVDNAEVDDSTLKLEENIQNFDSYEGENSNFESFNFDPSDENFDAGQSASWDNSQAFDEEEGNADDPTHRRDIDVAHTLMRHIQVDMERQLRCLYCSYSSEFPTNLERHMRRHTGEKPFACPHCPYRASQKVHLNYHSQKKHSMPDINKLS